jgi:hypothetical protein
VCCQDPGRRGEAQLCQIGDCESGAVMDLVKERGVETLLPVGWWAGGDGRARFARLKVSGRLPNVGDWCS